VFGTNAVFSLTLRWPQRNAPIAAPNYVEDRINIPTERHDRIVAAQREKRYDVFALDHETRQRIDVVHVNAAAPSGGDGSVEHPVATLAGAETVSRPGSIIFVRSGTYTEGISLQNGQRLLGDGLGNHSVSSLQGQFLLPDQTVGALPIISPTQTNLANFTFGVVMAGTFGNEVAGFNIINTGPQAVAAIGAISNGSFYVHDNLLSTPSAYGMVVLNTDSNGTWSNGTAISHPMGIFNNTIHDNALDGILIAHVPHSANAQFPDPRGNLTLDVRGNTITNSATSLASTALDTAAGLKARFGIAVASVTTTTITVNIDQNVLSGNGVAGDVNNATDGTGGIAVAAASTGHLNANVTNNTVDDNIGIGIAAITRSAVSQLTLTTNGNQITNQSAASINNPITGGSDSLAIGIAGFASGGQLTLQLTGDRLDGTPAAAIGTEERDGILLVSSNAASLGFTGTNLNIHDWADNGIRAEILNTSQATFNLSSSKIYSNGITGMQISTRDSAQLTSSILSNLFGSHANGNLTQLNGEDALIASFDQSTINLTFNNNTGDPFGFEFFKDAGATFNVSASGNSPTPIGP
jgi:hypothetical protein